jgi:hypothetical protein
VCKAYQKRGIITLIPKGEKIDSLLKILDHLVTHLKIFTKIIANRLNPILETLISKTQNAYIKGRSIINNLRTVQDIIENYKSKYPAIIAILDFEKAFDVVSWNFLRLALKKMNFGENIINAIFTAYTDIESGILIKGELSSINPFVVSARGTLYRACFLSL